mmetsp:Transcript_3856/g.8793  ORF Transcript_3856/g.8793 Transcript_3856/m.8793 type:complete len:204 (-) Transcript_3856:421-1032(-)
MEVGTGGSITRTGGASNRMFMDFARAAVCVLEPVIVLAFVLEAFVLAAFVFDLLLANDPAGTKLDVIAARTRVAAATAPADAGFVFVAFVLDLLSALDLAESEAARTRVDAAAPPADTALLPLLAAGLFSAVLLFLAVDVVAGALVALTVLVAAGCTVLIELVPELLLMVWPLIAGCTPPVVCFLWLWCELCLRCCSAVADRL